MAQGERGDGGVARHCDVAVRCTGFCARNHCHRAPKPVHELKGKVTTVKVTAAVIVLIVTGVTGTVRAAAAEQADRLLAWGDIKMHDGEILDTKDSLVPSH